MSRPLASNFNRPAPQSLNVNNKFTPSPSFKSSPPPAASRAPPPSKSQPQSQSQPKPQPKPQQVDDEEDEDYGYDDDFDDFDEDAAASPVAKSSHHHHHQQQSINNKHTPPSTSSSFTSSSSASSSSASSSSSTRATNAADVDVSAVQAMIRAENAARVNNNSNNNNNNNNNNSSSNANSSSLLTSSSSSQGAPPARRIVPLRRAAAGSSAKDARAAALLKLVHLAPENHTHMRVEPLSRLEVLRQEIGRGRRRNMATQYNDDWLHQACQSDEVSSFSLGVQWPSDTPPASSSSLRLVRFLRAASKAVEALLAETPPSKAQGHMAAISDGSAVAHAPASAQQQQQGDMRKISTMRFAGKILYVAYEPTQTDMHSLLCAYDAAAGTKEGAIVAWKINDDERVLVGGRYVHLPVAITDTMSDNHVSPVISIQILNSTHGAVHFATLSNKGAMHAWSGYDDVEEPKLRLVRTAVLEEGKERVAHALAIAENGGAYIIGGSAAHKAPRHGSSGVVNYCKVEKDHDVVTCMSLHPSKPFILMGYQSGIVSLYSLSRSSPLQCWYPPADSEYESVYSVEWCSVRHCVFFIRRHTAVDVMDLVRAEAKPVGQALLPPSSFFAVSNSAPTIIAYPNQAGHVDMQIIKSDLSIMSEKDEKKFNDYLQSLL